LEEQWQLEDQEQKVVKEHRQMEFKELLNKSSTQICLMSKRNAISVLKTSKQMIKLLL